MLWGLVAAALAGEPVEVSLRSGDSYAAELVDVTGDCAGELRMPDGGTRVLGTNALAALWFPERLTSPGHPVDDSALGSIQIQGFFPKARARIDGQDAGMVVPGDVLSVSPGMHLIYVNVPDCGRQRVIVNVEGAEIAPFVFNRPIEQYYIPKAIVTTTVGVLYLALRLHSFLPV